MTEYIYLYEPRNYSPGYAYRTFEDALEHFLKDNYAASLTELADECRADGWWYEFDVENEHVSVDDGGRINKIELR
jgi:hypothetical protein